MDIIELSTPTFIELANKSGTTVELLDGRVALLIGSYTFTTEVLHCPDCAAHLQLVEGGLRFLKHAC